MEIDTLNIVHKPIYDKINTILKHENDSAAYIVDAHNEHYVNRKYIRILSSRMLKRCKINFLCNIENISSILTCAKELAKEGLSFSVDVTTLSLANSNRPIFLVRMHRNKLEDFTLQPSYSKIIDSEEDVYKIMSDIILHDTLDRDVVTCVGGNSCNKFINYIKNNCRYFVGISDSTYDSSMFTNQSVLIVKRDIN